MSTAEWSNSNPQIIRVFVVRHGQTEWNIKRMMQGQHNVCLNSTGIHQASLLGERLRNYRFDYVVSSDLQRCIQTVKGVLGDKFENPNLNMKLTKRFRERYMGDVEGMHIDDARKKFGEKFRERGEPRKDMIERLEKGWNQLLQDSKDNHYKNVLMCAHGGVITNFFKYLYQVKHYKLGEGLNSSDLKVPYNTSLTIVDVNSNDFSDATIRIWASTSHLGGVKSVADQQLV